MLNLPVQQLQSTVAQLDQAIYNHEQWQKGLVRTLVARLPPDAADLAPDANHRCRFGQWYDNAATGPLGEYPAFIALDLAHERMHQSASRLLQRVADDLPVSASDLDQFENLLDNLRLELQSLRQEFVETVENRDPLTGARNRAGLLAYLREEHALVRRQVQQCALVMIDIDHFKEVNDRHGHVAGDLVLSATSQCLQAITRPYDHLFRYGGEEFLLCMPDTAVDVAADLAERLRSSVEAQQISYGGRDPALRVTASFGVAALDAALPVEESINRADMALYQAKAAGRNRVKSWCAPA